MSHLLRVLQRVGIDVDEDGEDFDESAALVDLAVLELEVELPFVPYPGLTLLFGEVHILLAEVAYDPRKTGFWVEAEPIWTQTQGGAQGIVDALLEAGFTPLESNHQEKDVH